MAKSTRCLTALIASVGLTLAALPASAQWIASGRWGTQNNWRHVVPGTWMVLRHDSASDPVSIHAEGDNNVGRIALWCDPQSQSSMMRFSAYRGSALRQPASQVTDNSAEPVVFVIDGQRFERSFTYDYPQRRWIAQDVLDAPFLDAFSWGTRMDLENAAGENITSYRLNRSGGAREALRRVCQF